MQPPAPAGTAWTDASAVRTIRGFLRVRRSRRSEPDAHPAWRFSSRGSNSKTRASPLLAYIRTRQSDYWTCPLGDFHRSLNEGVAAWQRAMTTNTDSVMVTLTEVMGCASCSVERDTIIRALVERLSVTR